MGNSLVGSVVANLALAALATAQIPAHATSLNPTTYQRDPVVLHDGDDVHVVAASCIQGNLFYARLRDGGRTWPLREISLGPSAGAGFAAAVIGLRRVQVRT